MSVSVLLILLLQITYRPHVLDSRKKEKRRALSLQEIFVARGSRRRHSTTTTHIHAEHSRAIIIIISIHHPPHPRLLSAILCVVCCYYYYYLELVGKDGCPHGACSATLGGAFDDRQAQIEISQGNVALNPSICPPCVRLNHLPRSLFIVSRLMLPLLTPPRACGKL